MNCEIHTDDIEQQQLVNTYLIKPCTW